MGNKASLFAITHAKIAVLFPPRPLNYDRAGNVFGLLFTIFQLTHCTCACTRAGMTHTLLCSCTYVFASLRTWTCTPSYGIFLCTTLTLTYNTLAHTKLCMWQTINLCDDGKHTHTCTHTCTHTHTHTHTCTH